MLETTLPAQRGAGPPVAAKASSTTLLQVSKLSAFYGATRALCELDFSLEAGHITAILGANGAGKTTTLRAICQTVPSDSAR